MGSMHVVGQDVSGGVVYRLAATHPEDVISLTAIESALAGFGAEGLADVTHGGVCNLAQDVPLRAPVTTIGSRGGGFTHAAFRGVTTQEATAMQLDGVGHYVAQEAPHALAAMLIEAFATNTP